MTFPPTTLRQLGPRPVALWLVWLSLACSGPASAAASGADADDASDTVGTLPTVEVVGRTPLPGLGQARDRVPGHVQLARDGQIEQSRAASLTSFMQEQFSGVSINDVQGNAARVDLVYRGFTASPTLGAPQGLAVYLDGVRINEAFGDVVNWDLLPEAAIASVMLVPGSNPLYGLNALGGALVLTSKSGLTHTGSEAELAAGSHGAVRGSFGQGRKLADGWHVYAAGSASYDGGWRDASPSQIRNLWLRVGRSQSEGQGAGTGAALGGMPGSTDWNLSLLHGSSRLLGNGLTPDDLLAERRSAIYTYPDRTRNLATQLAFQAEHRLDADNRLSLNTWLRSARSSVTTGDLSGDYTQFIDDCAQTPCDPADAPGAAVLNSSTTRQRGLGADLAWQTRQGSHDLVWGLGLSQQTLHYRQDLTHATFSADRGVQAVVDASGASDAQTTAELDGRVRTADVFVSDAIDLSPATQLSASLRYNRSQVRNHLLSNQADVGDQHERFNYSHWNPALGLTHITSSGLTLFGSVSQGTRMPTAIELGCADPAHPCVLPTGLQSDPYLKQVVALTLESGAHWKGEDTDLRLAVFRTEARNDIAFVRAQASQAGYFVNIGRTRRQGLELSAQQRLSESTQLRLSYALLDATYRFDGELDTPLDEPVVVHRGTRIAGLPRHTANLNLQTRPAPRWNLGAGLQWQGERVVAGNEDGALNGMDSRLSHVGGLALVHLRAAFAIEPGFEAYARVSNLLDRHRASYGQAGRNDFPGGNLVQPGDTAPVARFVAPNAGRSFWVGLRREWQ